MERFVYSGSRWWRGGKPLEAAYLHEYITFSRSLNFAQAATELFVSQPTLRAHIHALEDEVGAALTVKRNGALELSPTGKLFLKKARAIVKLTEESVAECRAFSAASSSLVVGTLDFPPFEDVLLRALAAFREDCPDQHMEILFASGTYANVESVVDGRVDLSIFVHVQRCEDGDVPQLVTMPRQVSSFFFMRGECRFWMNRSCPLFEREHISARDLDGYTLLLGNSDNMVEAGEAVASWFAQVGVQVEPDNQPCANYLDLYLSGLGETFGIALGGSRSGLRTSPDIRIFTVEDFVIPCDLHVLSNEERLDSCGQAFLERLQTLARESDV